VRGDEPHPVWGVDATRTWLDRPRRALEWVLGQGFRK
jgi:hypothetical protein